MEGGVTVDESEALGAAPPDQGADPAVVFRHVSKSYDGRTAVVKDLNLTVNRGEFLTILGPSGSGKTSILMMLAGFEQPTSGSIVAHGEDISRLPPHRRDIGMVFQHYALFPHLTIAENLAFPLAARHRPKAEIEKRVRWALDLVCLPMLGQRKPAELSGGQQQRIALARALIYQPELVLMDEPLGALDKQLREQMQEEIRRLHRELRPTVIYVTHDQGEALTMSDRIAVFDHGRIAQLAPPRALYEAPETAFVASFIGENNRLEGDVAAVSPGGCSFRLRSGVLVTATPVGVERVGVAASLSIRPERVRRVRSAHELDNVIEAVVTDMTFFGDALRLRCLAPGIGEIVWKLQNGFEDRVPVPGETIMLGWRSADARVFPEV